MKIIKYFFEFLIVISLFLIFKIVGCNFASWIGSILGTTFGPYIRPKSLIRNNLKIGLGNISEDQEKEIALGMWSNYGRTLAEYVYLNKFRSHNNSNRHIEINGLKILEKIKKLNKPVVFFSGHFGNFELMAMELDKFGIKLAAIYRPLNNVFLNPIMEYLRMKYICPNQLPKGRSGSRQLVQKIKDGYSIALMVDQSVTEGERIDFFKKPANTTTIPAQLALKYDCMLIPVFLERKEGVNFVMTINEPMNLNKTGKNQEDIKNITLQINQEIEKMILNNPTQWIWSHNRWK